jgi:cytochrome c biogenesis protein CcdA
MARKQVSQERKAAYYVGMALMAVGFLLFFSTFVTFAANFGDFTNFEDRAKSNMFRAISGMALLIIGGAVKGIGARGLAGSGVVLDPEGARKDLEPFSRQAGGMLKDALDEADLKIGGAAGQVVMVKCRACGKLNEEDSKFCQECGAQL